MDLDQHIYISWHNKAVYINSTCVMGGISVNVDNRLWKTEKTPFVLSLYEQGRTSHYAVKDEDAEDIIGRINKWYDDHPDLKRAAPDCPDEAFVSIGRSYERPFAEVELIKQWFDELKARSRGPLSDADYYHYTNPKPSIAEGDIKVHKIIEQKVIAPHNPTLPVPPPDNCRSELLIEDDITVMSVYSRGQYLDYLVPEVSISIINDEASQMLAKDADGYHQTGDADAWLEVLGRDDKFDIEPEDAISLFEKMIPQCIGPIPREHPNGSWGISVDRIRKSLADKWKCPCCGDDDNYGKICRTCGPSGIIKQAADVPWHCSKCNTDGNSGAYCSACGAEYTRPDTPDQMIVGYRKGVMPLFMAPGIAGMFVAQNKEPVNAAIIETKEEIPAGSWKCTYCGHINNSSFCCECGGKRTAT